MKRNIVACGLLVLGVIVATLPVSAHHSFSAQYDGSKIVYITGTLKKVDWSNPHIHFHVEMTESDGRVTPWTFEGSATTLVERNGTKRVDLVSNIGKAVTVRAAPDWKATNRGAAETVKLADGREMIVGGRRYTGEAPASTTGNK